MTSQRLAMIWLSGDMPFRPRWLAQEFVLKVALRDPVKAAEIVAELNNGSRHPSCGTTFAANLAEYRRRPGTWRAIAREKAERQWLINECRRGAGRSSYLTIPFPLEWSVS